MIDCGQLWAEWLVGGNAKRLSVLAKFPDPHSRMLVRRDHRKDEAQVAALLAEAADEADILPKLSKYHRALGLAVQPTTKQRIYKQLTRVFQQAGQTDNAFEALRLYHENAYDDSRRCVELTTEPPAEKPALFSRFGTNERFPCFVPSVSPDATLDRITTSQHLRMHELIMVARPFAWAFRNENDVMTPFCATCGRIVAAMLPCDRCSVSFFCSWKCRLTNETHAYECGTKYSAEVFIKLRVKLTVSMVLRCLSLLAQLRRSAEHPQEMVKQIIRGERLPPSGTSPAYDTLALMLRLSKADSVREGVCVDAYLYVYEMLTINHRLDEVMEDDGDAFLHHLVIHCAALAEQHRREFDVSVGGTVVYKAAAIYDAPSCLSRSRNPNMRTAFADVNMVGHTTRKVYPQQALSLEAAK